MRIGVNHGQLLASITLTLVAGAGCSSGPSAPVDAKPYVIEVQSFRAAKDELFRTSKESPLPTSERTSFSGLVYYPVNPAYRVPAALAENRSDPPVVIELPTSINTRRREIRVGVLGFSLEGSSFTLSVFAEEGAGVDRLFLPFGDLTSGKETYGGGRYLELDRTPTGLYDLDFNRAYHPYCVYSPSYECPVPPRENRLPIAIRAGERLP